MLILYISIYTQPNSVQSSAGKHNYIKVKLKSFPGEGEEKKDDFSSKELQEYADLFPFENLVFGGGGAKGVAYPGSLQVLYMSLGIGIIFY